ncbi:sodium:proton antiporter [Rufibacter sp. DG15C]|uniref:cation:proton antiporter domain-containing protein n=1 Tax=Rufibacter sp. DG15C TaxID=1379909 RepID=UPI00078E06DF|nr:cation:proton antiporter [Rufibacter sp. DG15C]AMM50584.1 sodium:proton antiporter [Rufibacter sp. DG15C]
MEDLAATHLPALITDLAFILGTAGITTLIFKKLKQPLVLGYILAGLLVGPNFTFLPSITDGKTIRVWGEIGVIFLLFNLGLEFSFKKLAKVGGTASITAITELLGMMILGFATGQLLEWDTINSMFLGGIMAISSTTIILRAFDELGVKTQKFTGVVFGVLIVEDLVAILLLVLLSTVAVSQQFGGEALLMAMLKLAFFLSIWFLGGIYLVPSFLRKASKLMNAETLLIISVALCLLMVVLASEAGFSPALGAFIMGSILAETVFSEKIEHLTKSVKDLFGAVFFVSVGMLINLATLADYIGPILLISGMLILGKCTFSTVGALISGQPLKQAIQVGLSLTQIGEFSFIIATLGVTLGVTSHYLYPIAVAVSALTTFTTPFLIRSAEPLANFLDQKLPHHWRTRINNYSTSAQAISNATDWQLVLRSFAQIIVTNSVILIGMILINTQYLGPLLTVTIANPLWGNLLTVFIALVLMSPFIYALSIRRIRTRAYSRLWRDKKYTRGPLLVLEIARILLALVFVGLLLDQLFSLQVALIIAAVLIGIIFPMLTQRLRKTYDRIERRFLTNLHARELENESPVKKILPWDAHLAEFRVSPESYFAGRTLIDLALRERFGINIARIERGRTIIPVPRGTEYLYPMDRITVIGTDEQLAEFKPHVEIEAPEMDMTFDQPDISLRQLTVDKKFPFLQQSIRDSGIREKTNGLVVGIERHGERILNPEPNTIFEPDDIVWLAGDTRLIKSIDS